MKNPLVVGAGLSGMATAWYLTEAGLKPRVVDAGPAPGGLIRTSRPAEGIVESAARSFIWTERLGQLFQAVNVTPAYARDDSKRRFIYRDGRARRWPLGPMETLSLAGHAGLTAVTRQMKAREGESVAQWADRALGSSARRWLIAPALQGIYATPAEELSARALFGGARMKGKMAAPPTGMGELFCKLHAALIERGVTFEFNSKLDALPAGDARSPVVICTSAPAAARLLANSAPEFAKAAARINTTWLLSVTAFYPKDEKDTRGFGVLFAREMGVTALGVLFNSDMFDGRSELRSETWFYGNRSKDALARIQSKIHDTLAADRRAFTKRDAKPVAVYPTPYLAELPVYDDNVLATADAIKTLPPWLAVTGNYLGKLGVSALVDGAARAAERVRANSNSGLREPS